MNAERLLFLADHLEHGTLGHKQFDFGVINIGGGLYIRAFVADKLGEGVTHG